MHLYHYDTVDISVYQINIAYHMLWFELADRLLTNNTQANRP